MQDFEGKWKVESGHNWAKQQIKLKTANKAKWMNCIFYPLSLHFWRRKTVLQFWQLILMWSSQCCLIIWIYSLTLYKRDCDRLYQNVHKNPQFGRTVSYYWQSSPTLTSGKSIMQTQKGFLVRCDIEEWSNLKRPIPTPPLIVLDLVSLFSTFEIVWPLATVTLDQEKFRRTRRD